MKRSAKTLAKGTPLCWVCGLRFVFRKGGAMIFVSYVDPIGNECRVHKDCASAVPATYKPANDVSR